VGTNYEGDGYNIVNQIANGTTIAAFGRFLGMDIGSALDLAERDGLVTILSEPNLTALSGETAEFLAGGEFPIPVSGEEGTVTIEYKRFGVSLAYAPTVLANGRISMRVRPEASELSSQGSVTLNGFAVPALTVRRAETTVELGSGQSFMIAGLLSNTSNSTIDKAPGAGDIPVLGALFRSTEFRKGQTELVIVVTPYLVRPVNDSEIVLPTDGYRAPDAASQWLLNRQSASVPGETRPMPRAEGEAAPPPEVSLNAPQPGSEMVADRRRQPGEGAEQAEAAAPGFSIQ
jgi:pilus assembly protein CpaC